MVIHDAECPYCEQLSLNNTNPVTVLMAQNIPSTSLFLFPRMPNKLNDVVFSVAS